MTGMIGARVGNWYVEAEAGRGPGGVVYRAKSYADGRPAAVKLLDDPGLAPKLAAELLALRTGSGSAAGTTTARGPITVIA